MKIPLSECEFLFKKDALINLLQIESLVLTKQLGQNFLIDNNIRQKLISFIPEKHPIIEIGSGIGHFTLFLLTKTSQLLGIEFDKGFYKILQKVFTPQANFLLQDVLTLEYSKIDSFLKSNPSSFSPIVVGNIPYYITKNIILKFLSFFPLFSDIFLLLDYQFFKDKLDKKTSSSNLNPLYCTISTYYTIKTLLKIPKNNFFPQPKGDSIFIRLSAKKNPLFDTYNQEHTAFIQSLFNHKNKLLPKKFVLNPTKLRVHTLTLDDIEKISKTTL